MTKHWETAASGLRAAPALHLAISNALADWDEAVQGRLGLPEALARLARSLGAECGLLVRQTASEKRPLRVATHDERRGEPVRPLVTSFADGHFGPDGWEARAAGLWLGSSAEARSAALPEWQAARRLREFVVLVLEILPGTRDHLELHFRQELSAEAQGALALMAPALARAWARRQRGLVRRALSGQKPREEKQLQPILGPANPMQLSRAEFRVCLLLSRGLSLEQVGAELGLARSTIRAHMRSIHAKTGTGSMAELVFALLDSRTAEDNRGRADA